MCDEADNNRAIGFEIPDVDKVTISCEIDSDPSSGFKDDVVIAAPPLAPSHEAHIGIIDCLIGNHAGCDRIFLCLVDVPCVRPRSGDRKAYVPGRTATA